jgi:hypothetical protein
MLHLYLTPTAELPIWSHDDLSELVCFAYHWGGPYRWVIRNDAGETVRAHKD